MPEFKRTDETTSQNSMIKGLPFSALKFMFFEVFPIR